MRSNTQQRQLPGFVPSIMPCIARKYLRLRNASYFSKALIFSLLLYFCIKAKESKTKFNTVLTHEMVSSITEMASGIVEIISVSIEMVSLSTEMACVSAEIASVIVEMASVIVEMASVIVEMAS